MQSKIALLTSVAVVCLGYSATVDAAPRFSGLSAGLDIGWAYIFGQIDDVNPNYANTAGFQDVDSANGALLGGHLGYDWQFDERWLVGIEASVASIIAETADCDAAGCSTGANGNPNLSYDVEGVATARLRVGAVVMPDTMVYVAGGWAFAAVETHHFDTSEGDGTKRNFGGYSLGVGVQHGVTANADVRLDVTYDHFSQKHWLDAFGENFGAEPEIITVSLGAVWHLN